MANVLLMIANQNIYKRSSAKFIHVTFTLIAFAIELNNLAESIFEAIKPHFKNILPKSAESIKFFQKLTPTCEMAKGNQ